MGDIILTRKPSSSTLNDDNKSGIASKRQLLVGACVVDSGYDGEIFINLHNMFIFLF